MNTTMNRTLERLARQGLEQDLARLPRQKKVGFGLREGIAAHVVEVDGGGAAVEFGPQDARIEDVGNESRHSVRVRLSWDELEHWSILLDACDRQHGVEVTDRYFVR